MTSVLSELRIKILKVTQALISLRHAQSLTDRCASVEMYAVASNNIAQGKHVSSSTTNSSGLRDSPFPPGVTLGAPWCTDV